MGVEMADFSRWVLHSTDAELLCQGSDLLALHFLSDTCHQVSSMSAPGTTAAAHTTAPQEGSGILTVLLQLGSVDAHFLA